MGIGGSATAAPAQVGEPQVLAKDLAGPLTTAVAEDGTAYVTANFGGSLWKVPPGGDAELVFQSDEEGAEVGGVSVAGRAGRLHPHRQDQEDLRDHRRQRPEGRRQRREVREAEEPRQGDAPTASAASARPAPPSCPRTSARRLPGHRRLAPLRHRAGRRRRLRRRRRRQRHPVDRGRRRRSARWRCCRRPRCKATKARGEGHSGCPAASPGTSTASRPCRPTSRWDPTAGCTSPASPVARRTAASAPRAASTR